MSFSSFPKTTAFLRALGLLTLLNTTATTARPDTKTQPPRADLPTYTVTGRDETAPSTVTVDPDPALKYGVDTASLLRGAPGANVNNNGPLSRQAQYRGLFGERSSVRVDGMALVPGGPNWMDAPLHYADPAQLEALNVRRGVTPVSEGPEIIGGTIDAETRTSAFTASESFTTRGRARTTVRTNPEGVSTGLFAGAANRRHRFHVLGGHTEGDDRDFQSDENETVAATEFEKAHYGFGYGFRHGPHEIAYDFRRHRTGESGNPSLPMDIDFLDTDLHKLRYDGRIGEWKIGAQTWFQQVDHAMNNFTLRPAPDFFTPPGGAPPPLVMAFGGDDRRRIDAESETLAAGLTLRRPLAAGTLAFGADFRGSRHHAEVTDPDSAFAAEPFDDVERYRRSLFAEWSGSPAEGWHFVAGLRGTRVDSDADRVSGPPLPPAENLRDDFNNADRDRDDTFLEGALLVRRSLGETATLRLGFARKVRAPSYLERYAWLPIEATAGFADGNNTVGRLGLDPEIAHEATVGVDWHPGNAYLTPAVFYRDIDDYIQPTPTARPDIVAVSTVNGDPTPLRYSNVGAEFYGADMGFGYRFDDRWRLDGTVSYVRGRRTDIDDDLFRIAPLNGTVSVTHERAWWRLTAETEWAAGTNDVSETNGEPPSDGYVLLHLAARFDLG